MLLLLFCAVTTLLQQASGTYSSDYGGYPDEAGHYVTGLMVRDYVAGLFPGSPLRFAENYYLHYPKVAFGHWPPVFYIIEAGCMLVFPASRVTVMLLMAVLTAIVALLVYREARERFGLVYGVTAGFLFTCLPAVQSLTSMVMVEVPLAMFAFLAVLRLARFLDEDSWQNAWWFGIFSSIAILTKGNAWALAGVPAFALLLTRDFKRLASARFWIPASIVLVLCVPYHILTWKMIHHGWPTDPGGIGSTLRSLPQLSGFLVQIVGLPLFLFAGLGIYVRVIAPCSRRACENYWAVMAGYILSFFVFHALLYHSIAELRYFVMIAPPMILFVVAGIQWLAEARFLSSLSPALRVALVTLCAGGSFAAWTFTIPPRTSHGFDRVAERMAATPSSDVILVSSSGYGEGMFIAELAEQEKRPSHIVLRASQQLASSEWTGENYVLRYQTPAQVELALQEIPVRFVVAHTTRPAAVPVTHHQLLLDTLHQYGDDWEEIASYPAAGGASPAEEIQIYRSKRFVNKPHRITVDLTNKLNKVLTGQF